MSFILIDFRQSPMELFKKKSNKTFSPFNVDDRE